MVIKPEFPSYIGFGRLKPFSISENNGDVSADYFFNETPVHRIFHNKDLGTRTIEDIFDAKGNISSSSDLKHAVRMHFNNLDCKINSLFHFVKDKVCSLGNILFENLASMYDEGGVVSYYPEGRLIILRLPVFFDEIGRKKANVLLNKIPYIDEEERPLLELCEAYNTSILHPQKDGVISVIPVLMIEYIVTLVSIYDVVNWMCSKSLIGEEKMFRLIIQDSNLKNQHFLQLVKGGDNEVSSNYTVLF